MVFLPEVLLSRSPLGRARIPEANENERVFGAALKMARVPDNADGRARRLDA
jgi:hypothetical protein